MTKRKQTKSLADRALIRINDLYLSNMNQEAAIEAMKKERSKRRQEIASMRLKDEEERQATNHRICIGIAARKQYGLEVWRLTRLQPLHVLQNYEKRSFKGWHVDHVLSITEGFKRGLPPAAVAHISNLRMLPAKENLDKGTRTVYTNLFNEAA